MSIKEINIVDNNDKIHSINLEVNRTLCFSSNFNHNSIEHDNLFTNTLESDYLNRTKYVLVNNTSNILEYDIPEYNSIIHHRDNNDNINTNTESTRRSYNELFLDHELTPVIVENSNNNINNTSNKDITTIQYDISNEFIELGHIRYNSKYKVRITSELLSKDIEKGLVGSIYVNKVESINTKGIKISNFIIDTLINHAEKYTDEMIDINSIIMFDNDIHKYYKYN